MFNEDTCELLFYIPLLVKNYMVYAYNSIHTLQNPKHTIL